MLFVYIGLLDLCPTYQELIYTCNFTSPFLDTGLVLLLIALIKPTVDIIRFTVTAK